MSNSSLATRPYIHTELLQDTTFESNSEILYCSVSSSASSSASSPNLNSKESFEDTRLEIEHEADQDCARDDWVQGNPSRLAQAWHLLRKNTSTRFYYVTGFIVVVLLVVSAHLVSSSERMEQVDFC